MKYFAKFKENGERETSIVEGIHFTTEDELKKYLDDGFIKISDEDQELYATNEYLRDKTTGKPIVKPVYVPNVGEAAEAAWVAIKSARDTAEQSGCPYMGRILDSDTLSVQRITTAVQAAQVAQTQRKDFTIDWTMQDNSVVQMTAVDVLGMPVALASYSDQIHEKARQLRDKIEKILEANKAGKLSDSDARTALKATIFVK